MKKYSTAIVIAIVVVVLAGVAIVGRLSNKKNSELVDSDSVVSKSNEKSISNTQNNVFYGSYNISTPSAGVLKAEYIKADDAIKFYALNPLDSIKGYDISSNGRNIVYEDKDEHLWAIYSNGELKKITPDKYESIDKSNMGNKYIWADKPLFIDNNKIMFISNLPDTSDSPEQSLWEIASDGSKMKKLYSIKSSSYKYLGYREDGSIAINDGDEIAFINQIDGTIDTIDVKDKEILSLSKDGTRIIYIKKNNNGKLDYNGLYAMNPYGKEQIKLPVLNSFTATNIGEWNKDSSKYAYIAKSSRGNKCKVVIINFDEEYIHLDDFDIGQDINIDDNTALSWSNNDASISIETGDNVLNIDME
jgi:hypothetical protein